MLPCHHPIMIYDDFTSHHNSILLNVRKINRLKYNLMLTGLTSTNRIIDNFRRFDFYV